MNRYALCMDVWAIADLHLSFGVLEKSMDAFGTHWEQHAEKIRSNWEKNISHQDLVLISGDISWAMKPHEALIDLNWIHNLPGTKVMIKGNHDYWWSSFSKVQSMLPSSIHAIQNNAFNYHDVSIAGARLWDTEEYSFEPFIEFLKSTPSEKTKREVFDDRKIFQRELERLELSLKELDQSAKIKIAMTHYPPIGADLKPSSASKLLEKYHVDICIFGHLHSLKSTVKLFGKKARNVQYLLTSCDYLDFNPLKIYPSVANESF